MDKCDTELPEVAPISVNNKIITEPYKTDKSIKSEVSGGIARPAQKTALKGLRVLMDAKVMSNGIERYISRGSMVYIKEETLHTQKWSTAAFTNECVPEPFIIVDFSNVEFVLHG